MTASHIPNTFYYIERGEEYIKLSRYEEAIQNYDQAIARLPISGELYHCRGEIHIYCDQYTNALEDFNQAIQLAPQNADNPTLATYYISRAQAYRYLKAYDKALADHDTALQRDNNNEFAYTSKAITYLWHGNASDLHRAQDELQKSCNKDSRHLFSAWLLVWCQFCQQSASSDVEELAEQFITIAARDTGENTAEASLCRGVAHWIRHQLAEAQAECHTAIQANPDHWQAYFWRGVVSASLDQKRDAEQAIEKALANKIPPLLLRPLHRLKQGAPAFYQTYALPLLTQLGVIEEESSSSPV
jgi:tetratricopeptide (TPR) repeat protein